MKVGTGIENRDVTGETATLQIAADTNVYLWAKVSGPDGAELGSVKFQVEIAK